MLASFAYVEKRSRRGSFFFWRSQRSRVAVRFDPVGIGMPSLRTESMHRRFGLYAAFVLRKIGLRNQRRRFNATVRSLTARKRRSAKFPRRLRIA